MCKEVVSVAADVEQQGLKTGVHFIGDIAWLWEEESMDLAWEYHLENCPLEDHDQCHVRQGTTLYGDWIKRGGVYVPDPRGEYSAIYEPESFVVQVVLSSYAIQCHRASPCYPGQGDVDTPGDQWAYCLPPELMQEEWLRENMRRIKRNKEW